MSLRILIIEDDKQISMAMKRKLESDGYLIETAFNGKDGVEIHDKEPFDIIITDLIMPEQDGIETIQYLKKHYPDQQIIAISGGGLINAKNYLEITEKMGVTYNLEKPFKLKDLSAVIELIKSDLEE